jgi:arsenate reductase
VGIDIHKHRSKHVNELLNIDFDYVVTVCDNAREQCPIFPGKAKVIHKCIEDPAKITGCQEEVYRQFRKVRDEIKEFVMTMPESLEQSS